MTAPEEAQLLTIVDAYAKQYPQSPLPMDGLGLANYRAGQWERARLPLLRSIELRGDTDEAILASVVLALVHLRQAQPGKAEPILKRVDAWLAAEAKSVLPPRYCPWPTGLGYTCGSGAIAFRSGITSTEKPLSGAGRLEPAGLTYFIADNPERRSSAREARAS